MARRKFSKEFKRDAVRLLENSGKSLSQVCRELGLRTSVLGAWKRMVEAERKTGLTTDELGELAKLRKDNDRLRMEVEILKNHPAPGCSLFPRNSSSRTVRPSREERPSAFWCLEPDKKHGPGVAAGLPLVTLCDPV